MLAQKFGILMARAPDNLNSCSNFYLSFGLRRTFNEARAVFIREWCFHLLEACLFEVFRFHKIFPAILFWNRYKDAILYHTEKRHTLDLIVAVPNFITHDILINKKWFYCMKSRFPRLCINKDILLQIRAKVP